MDILYDDNSGVIELDGLTNAITGQFINDASVTAQIQLNGSNIAGETWPLTMAYVASSDGLYRALLAANLDLAAGKIYTAIVTATSGGIVGEWNCRVLAKDRPCK